MKKLNKYAPNLKPLHHAWMLEDNHRIERYANAIKQIILIEDLVVDLGSGIGILTNIASRSTQSKVVGIEFYEFGYKIAKASLRDNDRIEFINKSSCGVQLDYKPTALIPETIGQVGPEEGMIESVFDFINRHPSIEKIIPAKLSIFAVPIYSLMLDLQIKKWLTTYSDLQRNGFEILDQLTNIEHAFCNNIYQTTLRDAKFLDTPMLIAAYTLGKSTNSSFHNVLKLTQESDNANAVHIYFCAELAQNIFLSTSITQPITHWKHSYVLRPTNSKMLILSYNMGDKYVQPRWG